MYKIAILGASGYTGAELIRIISNHPEMEITVLAAYSKAGLRMEKVFPHLRSLKLPSLMKIENVDFSDIDFVQAIKEYQGRERRYGSTSG